MLSRKNYRPAAEAVLLLRLWVQRVLFALQRLDELLKTFKRQSIGHASTHCLVVQHHLVDFFAFPTHSQFPAVLGEPLRAAHVP